MVEIKIMVVDDDPGIRAVLAKALAGDGYRTSAVSSAAEALALFSEALFEVVIVDLQLEGMDGLELLGKIKELSAETQVIIITRQASLESAVDALRAGAYDYLRKPFEDLELVSAVVKRAAEKIRLTRENAVLIEDLKVSKRELEEKNEVLMNLAIRDGLTGLYNHRFFQKTLSAEVARAARHASPFSVIFLDLDHFKKYNDSNGHIKGDSLLCAFGGLLAGHFRTVDMVARYGGEEFVILLPDTAYQDALCLAEDLRKLIEGHNFEESESQPLGRITASMGVASFPLHGTDPVTLLKKADQALYSAKHEGRNRVCGVQL